VQKLDLKKEYRRLFNPPRGEPEIVEVPALNYMMIDGIDARPESESFQNAIQTLFKVSFKAKFISKKELGRDFVVMPLEGLWWADDMSDFVGGRKERWCWTLMIMQPGFVTAEIVGEAAAASEGKVDAGLLSDLRLEELNEGPSAQLMHIGPFSEEHGNIVKLHESIGQNGGSFNGKVQKHHEIYLSDLRKTVPEKLRTIIRQPFVI
jgi:hypothetical protein